MTKNRKKEWKSESWERIDAFFYFILISFDCHFIYFFISNRTSTENSYEAKVAKKAFLNTIAEKKKKEKKTVKDLFMYASIITVLTAYRLHGDAKCLLRGNSPPLFFVSFLFFMCVRVTWYTALSNQNINTIFLTNLYLDGSYRTIYFSVPNDNVSFI